MNLNKNDLNRKNGNGMSHASVVVISVAVTVLILGVAGVFWLMQNPLAGMFGSEVDATVESTENTEWTGATIPNYVGKSYDEIVKLDEADDTLEVYRTFTDEFSEEYKEGTIISQTPVAGSKITQEDGVVISVSVSKGPQMRELPKVEGKKLDEVAADIAEQGFLASTEYQYSDTVASERVIGYKSNQTGDTLEYGSSVVLIVSKGKEPQPTQQ